MLARKSGGRLSTAYSPRRIADFLIEGARVDTAFAGRLSIHAASRASSADTKHPTIWSARFSFACVIFLEIRDPANAMSASTTNAMHRNDASTAMRRAFTLCGEIARTIGGP